MKVVAFTGLPGSGKSEAVGVAEAAGMAVVRMGDEVRAEAAGRGLPMNDENLGGVASEMRKREGMDVWAMRCLRRIEKITSSAAAGISNRAEEAGRAGTVIGGIVIDGIRNMEEVEAFRRNIGDFVLIAIHASPGTRYKRLMERGREDDSLSVDALRRRDERELGWGLGNVVAMADIIVTNEGSLEEFREKVRVILAQIGQN